MSNIDHENPHQHLLQRLLPNWSQHASVEQWQSLHAAVLPAQHLPATPAAWFANAAPHLREAVYASQARLDRSQQALARSLRGLQGIAEFAEPRLAQWLLDEHQLSAPPRSTELIHIHPVYTWGTYVNHHERRSLLEAALHNFDPAVAFSPDSALALAGDAHIEKTVVIGKTTLGDSETLVDIALDSEHYTIKPLPLAPADFAHSCRVLNIGQRYQDHLTALFAPPPVKQQAQAVLQDQLRLAADLALLRHQLDGIAVDKVHALLTEPTSLACSQLSLFGITLHEALILDLDEAGLLLYLPGFDLSLRQFSDLAALHEQLCDDLLQPAQRKAFMAFVTRDQQGLFFSRLQQNLDSQGSSAADQTWPRRAGAELHLVQVPIADNLFDFLHQDYLARLKGEARQLAVPTADADEQARKRRLAAWENLGLNTLMLAGFFVPGVGTLMTAVVAYQLLDEVYEGYQAWSVGDRQLALRHLEAVGLNLALIGGLHGAGKLLPRLFNSSLMESLEPIRTSAGEQRLWHPDLALYASDVVLPEGLQANLTGQFEHQGRSFIRIDDQLYQLRQDATLNRWRIVHPTDPEAYQPLLEHNGEGAWRAEHEQPQAWTPTYQARRLHPDLAALSDVDLHQALQVSGTPEQALAAAHLASQPNPLLLMDSLSRLHAQRLARVGVAEAGQPDLQTAFQRIYLASQATDPLADRLAAEHPLLTPPLAARLTRRLDPAARAALLDGAQWPAWLLDDVNRIVAELPLTQALQGVWLGNLMSQDSERLLLACLERLPAWPATLRLEIRAGGPQGPVLEAIGESQAQAPAVIIKSANGYEVYRGDRPAPGPIDTDLCQAIVDALPDAQRQALGWRVGSAEEVRTQVLALVAQDRQGMARQLWETPRPRWGKGGLRGGDPARGYDRTFLRSSLATRYRRLFPRTSELEYQRLRAGWLGRRLSPELEIERLENQLGSLRRELNAWAGTRAQRQPVCQRVENAWRRNEIVPVGAGRAIIALDLGGLDLANEDLASLPLPEGLGHVNELRLSSNPRVSQIPPNLIARLPTLNRLMLSSSGFEQLPLLQDPAALQWLDLDGNPLRWDAVAQATFDSYVNLRVLDFSGCPLGQAPNLTRQPGLSTVYMTECGLSTLPQGLHGLRDPLVLDFARNPLTHLPAASTLPAQVGRALHLESNSLSAQVMAQIEAYHTARGIDLLVADIEYEALLNEAGGDRLAVWQRLPLAYRRDLRRLLRSRVFTRGLPQSVDETWRRLTRMDQDIPYRQRALAQPAVRLLDLPIAYT
ncbi:hypothetical protein J2W83_000937 [Pseudomonas hunanensis]|uniref:Uncharacterized protein n=1 Tax=Pseudomonas hunanensis TaxID=1247546 RepID=A0ACC6JYR5_9PSED|nr:DUF6543 domain-containing protein [Pseudomonas hunanensis]MDR6711343.1 hypothetical protein [Pseudomonas hunanensis]